MAPKPALRVPKLSKEREEREKEYRMFIRELGAPENSTVRARAPLFNCWEKPLSFLKNDQCGNPISLTVAAYVFDGILSDEDLEAMKSNGIFKYRSIPGRESSTYLAQFQDIRKYIVIDQGIEFTDLRAKVKTLRSRYATYLKSGNCGAHASEFSASSSTRSRAGCAVPREIVVVSDEDKVHLAEPGTAGGLLGSQEIFPVDSDDDNGTCEKSPSDSPSNESPHSFLRRAQGRSAAGSVRSDDIQRSLSEDIARSSESVRSIAQMSAEQALVEQNLRAVSDEMDLGLPADVIHSASIWILSRSRNSFNRFKKIVYSGFGDDRARRREGLRTALESSANITEDSFMLASCICRLVEGDDQTSREPRGGIGQHRDLVSSAVFPGFFGNMPRTTGIPMHGPVRVNVTPAKPKKLRIRTVGSALTAAFVAGILPLSDSDEAEKNVGLERKYRLSTKLDEIYGTEQLPLSRSTFYCFQKGVKWLVEHHMGYSGAAVSGVALLRLRMSHEPRDCSIQETKIPVLNDPKTMGDKIHNIITDKYNSSPR